MKKVTGFMGVALLAGSLLAGCSADSEKVVPEEEVPEETVTPSVAEEANQETEKTEKIEEAETAETTKDMKEQTNTVNNEPNEPAEEPAAEATGTFNGIADPHTVEIEVNGEPAAYQVEAGGEAMAKFEAMEAGESVTFVYTENGEQLVINEVKTAAHKAEEATGTFNGIADPHTVEIEVNGEPTAYQVEAGSEAMAKFETMEAGESVTFVYMEHGEQLVVKEVK